MRRNRRAGVEDRWTKTVRDADGNTQTLPSANKGKGKRWRARYVDERGREHAKGFTRKVDAHAWLDGQTAAIVSGTHVAPRDAQMSVEQWCDTWLEGYRVNRESTVRQAQVHIAQIGAEFGAMQLSEVRPSHVKAWVAKLQRDLAPAYVYSLHSRLSQILADAVYDGVLGRNPCSRRTSPPMGKQKPYVATTEQVWAIARRHARPYAGGGTAGRVRRFAGGRSVGATGVGCGFHEGSRASETAVAGEAAQDGWQRPAGADSARSGSAVGGVGAEVSERHDGDPGVGHVKNRGACRQRVGRGLRAPVEYRARHPPCPAEGGRAAGGILFP